MHTHNYCINLNHCDLICSLHHHSTRYNYSSSFSFTISLSTFLSPAQIELEGTSLIVLSDTYDITPSPDPTGAEEGIDDGDLVLIVAGGGAAVAVFLCLSIVCIVCCVVCCHGNKRKGKKGTRWSERSSVSQLPRLRPSFKVSVCVCVCVCVCHLQGEGEREVNTPQSTFANHDRYT